MTTPRRANTRLLVACVGDSITHGSVSSNYVDLLNARWGQAGAQFLNFGKNGNLAYNVDQRLDEVIDARPDVVTLLIGTNDVNAQFDETMQNRYVKEQRLPQRPTREWYAQSLRSILGRLTTDLRTRVAVLEIPPLGEDLGSRMNALVDEYNGVLRLLASEYEVEVLPLHQRLVHLLPTDHRPPPYHGSRSTIVKAAASHLIMRRSWDEVSRRNGLSLLTDHIHLNDRAAGVVADLVGDVVEPELSDPS